MNDKPDDLSPREREVAKEMAEGKTTKEIASSLGLSIRTIDTYRTRIRLKLDVHSAVELVRLAIRTGLIEP